MIYKIMAVYDLKAEAFERPFFCRSTAEGERMLANDVNSEKRESNLSLHPEDYQLFELGSWDEVSGVIQVLEKPRLVKSGEQLRKVAA